MLVYLLVAGKSLRKWYWNNVPNQSLLKVIGNTTHTHTHDETWQVSVFVCIFLTSAKIYLTYHCTHCFILYTLHLHNNSVKRCGSRTFPIYQSLRVILLLYILMLKLCSDFLLFLFLFWLQFTYTLPHTFSYYYSQRIWVIYDSGMFHNGRTRVCCAFSRLEKESCFYFIFCALFIRLSLSSLSPFYLHCTISSISFHSFSVIRRKT